MKKEKKEIDPLQLLIAQSIDATLKSKKEKKVVLDIEPEEKGILFEVKYTVNGIVYNKKQTMQLINKEISALEKKRKAGTLKYKVEYKRVTPLPEESGTKQ